MNTEPTDGGAVDPGDGVRAVAGDEAAAPDVTPAQAAAWVLRDGVLPLLRDLAAGATKEAA